jgi:hypothetical protein
VAKVCEIEGNVLLALSAGSESSSCGFCIACSSARIDGGGWFARKAFGAQVGRIYATEAIQPREGSPTGQSAVEAGSKEVITCGPSTQAA